MHRTDRTGTYVLPTTTHIKGRIRVGAGERRREKVHPSVVAHEDNLPARAHGLGNDVVLGNFAGVKVAA